MQANSGSWRDFGPEPGNGSGRARRFKLRRNAQAAPRRPRFVRSDVRRGTQAAISLALPGLPLPEAAYEKLMTLRLQAAIVTAMLGISAFYRAPLLAALKALFAQ